MNISSFTTKEGPPQIDHIISQLFVNRIHKKIPIDRSQFDELPSIPLNHARKQYSQISSRSRYTSFMDQEDKILSYHTPKPPAELKSRIIRKARAQHRALEKSKEIHHKYNNYLIQFLHKSNKLSVRANIPPSLSVLQTIDQDEYVLNDQGTLYERKDYPHYSNVIQPHEIEAEKDHISYLKEPRKIRPEELYFQIEDNCVLKVKQIIQFVSVVFRKSIQFNKRMKNVRNLPGVTVRESENHDFENISKQVNIHFRTAKLLYDLLNQYYKLDNEMSRNEQNKLDSAANIKQNIKLILQDYGSDQPVHIPHSELYISLRQLRQLLHKARIELKDDE